MTDRRITVLAWGFITVGVVVLALGIANYPGIWS